MDDVLVDRLSHVDNLEATLLYSFDERAVGHLVFALAGDVVDVFLVLLHTADVVLQRALLISRGGGVVAQKLRQLLPVLAVLVDTQLQVLTELLVTLLVVLLVFGEPWSC